MIGIKELAQMKPDGVLINIARGPIVDEVPLWTALQNQRIGGAVLDVWWNDFSWFQNGTWPSTFNFSSLPNAARWGDVLGQTGYEGVDAEAYSSFF
ncbi:Glyoxylate/hydroxypyruvate reductase B [Durusdinium trenchii]|uniref:Glyoxylate/hydroxypyruvate reductase B n=1 Tax=Durusdinium trenchii TaxID=1381693 RepID=A0ABP0MQ41_9DINO